MGYCSEKRFKVGGVVSDCCCSCLVSSIRVVVYYDNERAKLLPSLSSNFFMVFGRYVLVMSELGLVALPIA